MSNDFNLDEEVLNIKECFKLNKCTYKDIIEMAVKIGVNPQHLFGILTGTIYPHEIIVERLKKIFSDDIIDNFLRDFSYTEGLDIVDKSSIKGQYRRRILESYLALDLRQNDMVLLDTKDWLKVSSTRVIGNNIIVYSGGVAAFTCKKDDTVIAIKGKVTHENVDNTSEVVLTKDKRQELFNKIKKEYS